MRVPRWCPSRDGCEGRTQRRGTASRLPGAKSTAAAEEDEVQARIQGVQTAVLREVDALTDETDRDDAARTGDSLAAPAAGHPAPSVIGITGAVGAMAAAGCLGLPFETC